MTRPPQRPQRASFQIAAGVDLAVLRAVPHEHRLRFCADDVWLNTGWSWIMGAPSAIVVDAWTIRPLPHYWLGIFFVLARLGAAARVVMLAHGVRTVFADRFMVSGAVVAAIIPTWIILGISGMRVHFV